MCVSDEKFLSLNKQFNSIKIFKKQILSSVFAREVRTLILKCNGIIQRRDVVVNVSQII